MKTFKYVEVKLMTIKINGSLSPSDSKIVKIEEFEVPDSISEIHLKFDYIPRRIESLENQITLSIYDSMGNFVGRYDNFKDFVVGENPSPSAFRILPLPGNWKIMLENDSLVSHVNYTIEIEFTGNEKYKWYKGELHTHSIHSDGKFSVKELNEYLRSHNFDFSFLTDHNNVSGYRDLYFDKNSIGFIGEEISTFKGHILTLGNDQFVDWKEKDGSERSLSSIRKEIDCIHALMGVAHPSMLGEPVCGGCAWKYTESPFDTNLFDFVEIWNGSMESKFLNIETIYSWIAELRKGKRITATSGFDLHSSTDPEPSFWLKNHFYLRKLELTEILYAIKHGMTYISTDPITINFYDNLPGKVVKYSTEAKFKFELSDPVKGRSMIITKNDIIDLGEIYSGEITLKDLNDDDFAILIFFDKVETPLVITNPVYFKKIR
jgi:hypothetical protein